MGRKIEDDYSSSEEKAVSYKFGYGDDGISYDTTKLTQNLEDGRVERIQEGNVDGILAHLTSSDDYSVVFDEATGDVYSGRKYDGVVRRQYDPDNGVIVPVTEIAYECDLLYKGAKPVENHVEGADTFDNSTEFMTAGCVPEKYSFPTQLFHGAWRL